MTRLSSIAAGAALTSAVAALNLNVNDPASIKDIAAQVAKGLYIYHDPSSTAGQFKQPQPWFWWESGSAWNALMDYTMYTGDTTYKADLLSSLAKNVGSNYDFAPAEQANWEANDDQVYWVYNALSAMDCANSWLAIGTNAFNDFVTRWNKDSATCGGGLKWQYIETTSGYYYKNTVSNGGFFQTAARLARYTGNQTFGDWATKVWDWSTSVGFVSADFHVFDGAGDNQGANCSAINKDEWSYNIASYLHGAAHMYAFTNDSAWETRVQGLLKAAQSTFFGPNSNATNVMYEHNCELSSGCNIDQTSFKASLSRWLGKTAVLVPSVKATIEPLLQASASGAALSCSGYDNSTCGVQWYTGTFDGQSDLGVELSALEAIQSLLAASAPNMQVYVQSVFSCPSQSPGYHLGT
ncbi:glycoside hydrolase family 76 protein [Annulohypoxylon truncatum]|uniref:glycoside hydrolase family 76 protein n=1 Tax=Annulohypoxylon truncatum TaxID=327061 RepID=UPI002008E8BD|nr:glycoside hydrolase family 76 protein [Annulohypoxylon truncatum]KAI1213340.1 glycoside hydrolase family 76 protein [Annulohypoxylon truncatum]